MTETIIRFARFFRRTPVQATKAAFGLVAQKVRTAFAGSASRSGLGAALYYVFLSRRFQREQRAVLAGQQAFRQVDLSIAPSLPELRRNIHRIEKGLAMRPRRETFAEDYIRRTVEVWIAARKAGGPDIEEMRWASDVLETYFSVVGETQRINAARILWESEKTSILEQESKNKRLPLVPYPASERVASGVSFDDFIALVRERRSVRWYDDRSVDPMMIDRAIAAASFAASACNRQPYGFIVLLDQQQARAAAALAGGTAGWGHQIPALVVVTGDLSCYPHERDRHIPYIDASLALAQMLLALQTQGLSSCVINWPDVEERENALHQLLGIPIHQRVVALVAVGHSDPDGLIPGSQKKQSHVLTKYPTKESKS